MKRVFKQNGYSKRVSRDICTPDFVAWYGAARLSHDAHNGKVPATTTTTTTYGSIDQPERIYIWYTLTNKNTNKINVSGYGIIIQYNSINIYDNVVIARIVLCILLFTCSDVVALSKLLWSSLLSEIFD